MTSGIRTSVLVAVSLLSAWSAHAQQPQPLPAATPSTIQPASVSQPPRAPVIPLEVQIVVSRWQGDKKVSSLPYTMAVNANEPGGNASALRMSSRVAVPVSMFQATGSNNGAQSQPLTSYQYESVGTNIDCSARSDDDGRFRVYLSVDDSSLVPTTAIADLSGPAAPRAAIRSFKSTNNVLLKDGQTRQFTAATDRVTGEVVKIDVTLKVVK